MGKPFFHRDYDAGKKASDVCINKLIEIGKIGDYLSVERLPKGHPFRHFDTKYKIDGFISYTKFLKVPQTIQDLQDLIPVGVRANLQNDDEWISIKDTEMKIVRAGLKSNQKLTYPEKFILHNTNGDNGGPRTIFMPDSVDLIMACDVMDKDGTLLNKYRREDTFKDGRLYTHFSVDFIEYITGNKVWKWLEPGNKAMKF